MAGFVALFSTLVTKRALFELASIITQSPTILINYVRLVIASYKNCLKILNGASYLIYFLYIFNQWKTLIILDESMSFFFFFTLCDLFLNRLSWIGL